MISQKKPKGFDWNKGNIDKNYQKHNITPKESEEAFLDTNLKIIKDVKHSQNESRLIAIGKNFKEKTLFIIFTVRNNKIRIISARLANKKEREKYEKAIKKNS